jgi:tryptophanyl-tRNA synthetase
MSTTRGTPQGTVLVVDPPEVVSKKIRSAVTDSGREVRRGEGKRGIENLIEILSVATNETPEAIEAAYQGQGYGDFKGDVADAVVELLRPIRERYLELRADESELNAILERGRERAAEVADATLAEMLVAMGFRVPPRGG